MTEQATESQFGRFVAVVEPRLRQALTALYGPERGREATLGALHSALELGDTDPGADLEEAVRALFWMAQRRSGAFKVPPAFERVTDQERWIDPPLASALQVLPMRDRVAVLLHVGAGWTVPEIAGLVGSSAAQVERGIARWLPRLEAAAGASKPGRDGATDEGTDDDVAPEDATAAGSTLAAQLARLVSGSVPAVGPEEAVDPALARAASQELPELAVASRGLRIAKLAGIGAMLLLLLVAGVVIAVDATRPPTGTAYTTPGPEPAPGRLDDTVIVVPSPPQMAGARETSSVYEVGAGDGRALRVPGLGGAAATSSTVTSGAFVGEVVYPAATSLGRAVTFRVGSVIEHDLGRASAIYPGADPGTFWVLLHGATLPGGPRASCTVRLETADGRSLRRAEAIPCSWQVFAAVRAGLLVTSREGITMLWDPASGITDPLSNFGVATMRAVAGTLLNPQWSAFCAIRCQVLLADPATGTLSPVEVDPPSGASLTTSAAISPDGRFLAITAMPINDSTALENEPFASSKPPPEKLIHGRLVVVRIPSGKVAMVRPATYLYPSLIEWSPDGSYVWLTRSPTTVTAFPAWSNTAPETVIHLPAGATPRGDPAERFLLAAR